VIRDELLAAPPYATDPAEKQRLLLAAMGELTTHHMERCAPYRRMVTGAFPSYHAGVGTLADVPFLPVGVFKDHDLRSVDERDIFKVVLSSGTTGARPSRVALDRETASLQSRTLLRLLGSFVGSARRPLLVIDQEPVGGTAVTARYAATLGVLPLGRDPLYCLGADMALDRPRLRAWLEKHRAEPLLAFGFTFVVWKYFLQVLGEAEIDLARAILLHTGGWKRMADARVDRATFEAATRARAGVARVHDFYGMAEQVGSVFIECAEGVLHAAAPAEVLIRDARTWEPVRPGDGGLVQCFSALPTSYPGHSLLTEDLGTLRGHDGCPCGRRGTFFEVTGRVPRAELRGCSEARP
jgi:hypothetical protein